MAPSSLTAVANVLAPAYYLLQAQGYQVRYDAEMNLWIAEKDGVHLSAHDSIMLRG
ncbi:hypothetical protein HNQ93_003742 [Hymenobacter luteus]|uniref:Uncharacterized protein n=2 Tax=Hymenobacter TaxID=89966 RepID=A0A7W9T3F8_9BACT|nr:hypothetical protein [Hymenobacter latericoloratus]MBB6060867.1 hypothetical protein [Hymenobacter luteus]